MKIKTKEKEHNITLEFTIGCIHLLPVYHTYEGEAFSSLLPFTDRYYLFISFLGFTFTIQTHYYSNKENSI